MGEWVLIWMIFQSELGTTIIAPPPIYFHDHAACEAKIEVQHAAAPFETGHERDSREQIGQRLELRGVLCATMICR